MSFSEKKSEAFEHSKNVREIFSSIARRYDLGNSIISFGAHIHYKKLALLELNLKPADRLLDACTGTGDLVFLAVQLFPGIYATGIDISEEMIEVARKRLEETPMIKGRVDFQVADATSMPFDDASFDAVTVAFGLRNIQERGRFFEEAFRVLKPSGKAVILEFSNPKDAKLRPAYRFYLRYLVPVLGYLTTGNFKAYRYLTDSIFNYPVASEIQKIAEEAGFEFRLKEFLFGFLSLYICVKPDEE